jgi:hypothetical protein
MERDFQNVMPDTTIPTPPKIFHLRQLRHGRNYAVIPSEVEGSRKVTLKIASLDFARDDKWFRV